MNLDQYLVAVKEKLNASLIITSIEIVDARVLLNRGYFRARLTLTDIFLERPLQQPYLMIKGSLRERYRKAIHNRNEKYKIVLDREFWAESYS